MKLQKPTREGINTRALLEVTRDQSLRDIWAEKGITLEWVANVILSQAGFTDEEVAQVMERPVKAKAETKPVQLRFPGTKPIAKTRKGSLSNSSARWTKADDDRIILMWSQGHTATKIARSLKRSSGSVAVRIHSIRAERGDKALPIRNPKARTQFRKK